MNSEDLMEYGVLGLFFIGTCIVLKKTAKHSSKTIDEWRRAKRGDNKTKEEEKDKK